MKRKFLCLLLALTMVLGLAANVSGSGTKTVSWFAYGKIQTSSGPETAVERSTGSETVSWTLTDGLLTISGQGAMADYAEGEAPWLGEEIYSVVVDSGITHVGSNAFRGMELLQEITIGADVVTLGEFIAVENPALYRVTILGNLESIPAGSFTDCPNLATFWFMGDQPVIANGGLTTGCSQVSIQFSIDNATWKTPPSSSVLTIGHLSWGCYDLRWGESGSAGENVTWQILYNEMLHASSDYLLISGTGAMADFSEGEQPWLPYCNGVYTLVIANGVTTVGNGAFRGQHLSQIMLGGSVRDIGAEAFRGVTNLWNITFAPNLRYIGDYAFSESSYSWLWGSYPLPELGVGVFANCTNLRRATLLNGSVNLPDQTFYGCTALEETTIPPSITAVGQDAYAGCTALKTVTFNGTENQWESMDIGSGNEPLLNAKLLGVIPNHGTCGKNASWELDEQTHTLTISGTGAVTDNIWVLLSEQVYTIIVEEGITKLCDNAFHYMDKVTEVRLPDTLTSIGQYAFASCESLESITIPTGVTAIPEGAFSYCKKLVSVQLPEGLTSIGYQAFCKCESLSQIDLPAGVTELGAQAFMACKSLTHFEWPKNVTFVGSALEHSGITELVLPETVTAIGGYAFFGCSNLEAITIPDSVSSFGERAFEGTTKLKSIHIPEGITTIPFSCFNGSGITELILPEGLTTIEKYAFQSCRNLQKVVLPETVTSIADQVFSYCSSLSEINWPSGVDTIGWHQFSGSGLMEFTVPATVRTVESYAFHNSTKLEKLVFESKDTQIDGGQVLDGCPLLTVYCWNETSVQAAAEHAMVPYVLFDPPAEQPVYPIYTIIACGDGRIQVPAESAGYQWVYIDFIPGPDSALVDLELYYYSEYELELRVEAVDEDTIRLLMPRCPVEFVAYFQNTLTGFIDIKSTDFYYDPVIWAFSSGITTGISQIEFGPTAECNRAQVVTFLWRAAGSPEPSVTENPFVDVQPGSFYEKAVLWAVEMGITNGADATHFNPMGICNRAQVVTFLHRAFGSPALENGENPFADVPADTWYTAPVLWAVEMGITNGMGQGLFGVNNPCNRAQIVTFLYRAYTE